MNSMQLGTSFRQILIIALPIMGGNLFHSIVSFTDIIFMGYVGEDEFAACGIASMYYLVMGMLGYSFAIGGQILIARRAGENDHRSIGIINDNLFYILGLSSLLLFALLKYGSPFILGKIFSAGEMAYLSNEYLAYRSWGIIFIFQLFVLGAFYTGIGRTFAIILSTMSMAIINVFFNYVLIFGHLGFEPMGIAGAGLASLIAEIASFVIMMAHLLIFKFHKQFNLFKWTKPTRGMIRKITRLSGPIVIQSSIGAIGFFTFFILIENILGKHDLAVSNAIRIIYLFAAIPALGLAGATNTLVSNIIGQGRIDQVPGLVKRLSLTSLAFMSVICFLLLLFPSQIIGLLTNDTNVVQSSLAVMPIIIVALAILSIGNILFRTVTGAGGVRFALIMEFITFVIYIAAAYILLGVIKVDVTTAWSIEILYWVVLSGLSLYYIVKGDWKKIVI